VLNYFLHRQCGGISLVEVHRIFESPLEKTWYFPILRYSGSPDCRLKAGGQSTNCPKNVGTEEIEGIGGALCFAK
jgi:hypothetical protein